MSDQCVFFVLAGAAICKVNLLIRSIQKIDDLNMVSVGIERWNSTALKSGPTVFVLRPVEIQVVYLTFERLWDFARETFAPSMVTE